jgi:RND family efflux transporter MFP subunit
MKYKFLFSLIALAAIFCACSSGSKKPKANEEDGISTTLPTQVNEVKVMLLAYSDFGQELISNGTVLASSKADLRFQSSEQVAGIYVKNGDRVRKGQKLAELEQFKLKYALRQAQDNLVRANLELQDILIGLGYSLGDTASIPKDVMQVARLKSSYEQSVINCELAEYDLKNAVLYAPFDGIVANLFGKEYNLPVSGEPFCTIIDNSRFEVDFTVLESELPIIRTGNKVEIFPFSISRYSCHGYVAEINPAVDKTGMVKVKAFVDNPQGKLFEGMNVKVHVQRMLENQLVIPKEALVLRSNKKVVFTLKNGLAQWVYVQTGMENSTGYTVAEGLAAGDSVIYAGNINLAHEAPVVVLVD